MGEIPLPLMAFVEREKKYVPVNREKATNGLSDKCLMPSGEEYTIVQGKSSFGVEIGNPFNVTTGRLTKYNRFTVKQKKHYSRLNCGFGVAVAKKERLSFMTLTTQYEFERDRFGQPIYDRFGRKKPKYPRKYHAKINGLNYAWTKLKQRVEWYLQVRMYKRHCKKEGIEPYIYVGVRKAKKIRFPGCGKWSKACYACKEKHCFQKFRFKLQYFKVKTAEGGGVLHVVFRKPRYVPKIDFYWLQKTWKEIWGAHDVNIKGVPIRGTRGLSMYLVGQYFSQQPVIRASYGHMWVFRGFARHFRHTIETYGIKRGVQVWNKNVETNQQPKPTKQTKFGRVARSVSFQKEPCFPYPENRVRKYPFGAFCRRPQKGIVGNRAYFPAKDQIWIANQFISKTVQTCVDSPKYMFNVDPFRPVPWVVLTILSRRSNLLPRKRNCGRLLVSRLIEQKLI